MPATSIPPTSTGRAAPLPPDERRAAIIEAVMPLLIERGAAVTSRELAAAACVSEGTIFNVFDDKTELLVAAVTAATDQAPFEEAVTSVDPDLPFEDRLAAITDVMQRRVVDIWRLLSQIDPQQHPTAHRRMPDSPALTAFFAAEANRLRVEPSEAARLLRSMALALTHPMLVAEPATSAHVVDVFLNGAGVEA